MRYIIGESPSYREILAWFQPKFMLGMTATPDRTDRKDILELFDYNKIYELPLQDAIERGFLVRYTYYGLARQCRTIRAFVGKAAITESMI